MEEVRRRRCPESDGDASVSLSPCLMTIDPRSRLVQYQRLSKSHVFSLLDNKVVESNLSNCQLRVELGGLC